MYFLDKVERGILNAASSAQWPNNVVPYVLDAAFTSADRAIIAAVNILDTHQRVCIAKLLKSLYPNGHPLFLIL